MQIRNRPPAPSFAPARARRFAGKQRKVEVIDLCDSDDEAGVGMEIDLCDSPGVLVSPSYSDFPLAHNRMEMREATRRRVLVGVAPS